MPGPKELDQEYLTLMQPHPYGRAIYKPPAASSFRPGSTGYFNSVGDWNPIADLSAAQTASWPAVFSPPPTEKLLLAPLETQIWGPKLGTNTKGYKIDLQESVALTALTVVPLEAGTCFRFEKSTSSGSVLLVEGAVSHRRYYHEAPFREWVAANAKSILKERPEVKDYGLWVVTSTWSAAKAAINCWSGQEKVVDVGFNVRVVEIGEVAPKGGWYHAGESDGWIGVERDNQGGEKVLFFGGLHFRWRPIIGGLKHQKKPTQLRGDDHREEESILTFVPGVEDGEYELTCEGVLESESLRPMAPSQTQESKDEEDDEDW